MFDTIGQACFATPADKHSGATVHAKPNLLNTFFKAIAFRFKALASRASFEPVITTGFITLQAPLTTAETHLNDSQVKPTGFAELSNHFITFANTCTSVLLRPFNKRCQLAHTARSICHRKQNFSVSQRPASFTVNPFLCQNTRSVKQLEKTS